jgi:hypothetical protein
VVLVEVRPREIVPLAASVGAPRLLVAVPPLTLLKEPTEIDPPCTDTVPVKVLAPEKTSGACENGATITFSNNP